MPQSLSLLSAVSLLHLGALTFAHSASGGETAAQQQQPRHMLEEIQGYAAPHFQRRDWSTPDVDTRDKKHLRCGPGVGFCAPGDCCSHSGYCGRGFRHCESPNCQINYSDSCDSSKKPLGEPTLNVSRPLIGNVTYDSAGIQNCKIPGTIALTFDDGPYNYTSHVLDALASYGAKATFFITGNNLGKGQIDIEETGWPAILRRMHAEGHQIAGHSWGHQNMSSLNETEMVNQVHYLEMAIRNVMGFIPTYFRPPFDDCTSDTCKNVLKRMGYHISKFVQNWVNSDGVNIQNAKNLFLNSMRQTNPREVDYIFLLHDTHYQTSWNLTSFMLEHFQLFNYSRLVTVGECMGDPPQNWYRTAGGAPNRTLLVGHPIESR
ncbi:carbohydrate esterase family 4 protein [Periconia macrospinosa]|uniref:Carbohydrate esterase family 4 protein n=1 Tax=Periconia macrospinosa TaxID=97972 RepID=A0A2V1D1Q9_9PLEO|nr:carbohydrate esterase family 4 protein [Periconia macrospinosa]